MIPLRIFFSLLVAAAAILYFIDWSAFARAAQRVEGDRLLVMAASVAATLLIAALRWRILLRALGFAAPLLRITTVTLAAQGLNIIIPGGVFGDLFKALAVADAEEQSGSLALGSAAADRIVGLLALAATLVGTFAASVTAEKRAAVWIGIAIFAVLGVCITVLRLALKRFDSYLPHSPRLARRLISLAATTLGTVTAYRRAPVPVFVAFVLSIFGHVLICGGVWLVAQSIAPVPFAAIVLAVSLAFVATLIPVTVYGLGTRELVFVAVLTPVGFDTAQAVLLSLLWFGASVSVSLIFGALAAILNPEQIRSAYNVARKGFLGHHRSTPRNNVRRPIGTPI